MSKIFNFFFEFENDEIGIKASLLNEFLNKGINLLSVSILTFLKLVSTSLYIELKSISSPTPCSLITKIFLFVAIFFVEPWVHKATVSRGRSK